MMTAIGFLALTACGGEATVATNGHASNDQRPSSTQPDGAVRNGHELLAAPPSLPDSAEHAVAAVSSLEVFVFVVQRGPQSLCIVVRHTDGARSELCQDPAAAVSFAPLYAGPYEGSNTGIVAALTAPDVEQLELRYGDDSVRAASTDVAGLANSRVFVAEVPAGIPTEVVGRAAGRVVLQRSGG